MSLAWKGRSVQIDVCPALGIAKEDRVVQVKSDSPFRKRGLMERHVLTKCLKFLGAITLFACAAGCPQARPSGVSKPTGTSPGNGRLGAAPLPIALTNSVGATFIRIEPRTFIMGNGPGAMRPSATTLYS